MCQCISAPKIPKGKASSRASGYLRTWVDKGQNHKSRDINQNFPTRTSQNLGSGGTEHPGTPLPNSVLGADVPQLSQGRSLSRLVVNLESDYRNQEMFTDLLLWIAATLHKIISFLLLGLLI